MTRAVKTSGPERGAALLEVLLALAITALIAAAAAGVAGFGLGAVERAREAADRSGEALALRRELSDALIRIAPADGAPSARGSDTVLDWRGVMPEGEGWRSGSWRLGPPGATLYRCAAFGEECERMRSLAEGELRFAYARDDGEWRATWPRGGPPALIRAALGGTRIIVAPRTTGAAR